MQKGTSRKIASVMLKTISFEIMNEHIEQTIPTMQ